MPGRLRSFVQNLGCVAPVLEAAGSLVWKEVRTPNPGLQGPCSSSDVISGSSLAHLCSSCFWLCPGFGLGLGLRLLLPEIPFLRASTTRFSFRSAVQSPSLTSLYELAAPPAAPVSGVSGSRRGFLQPQAQTWERRLYFKGDSRERE